MNIFTIRKRNGSSRTIYCPDKKERKELKKIMPKIKKALNYHKNHDVVHGFIQGRSCITNAIKHRFFSYTLNMDIKDFFESVTYDKVNDIIKFHQHERYSLFPDGSARQGLPTSPALSNIATIKIDKAILLWIKHRGLVLNTDIAYTRYADDLCLSFNDEGLRFELEETITSLVSLYGFSINQEKTEFLKASRGRRNITGVMVDQDIHPSRKHKRRLRAAKHQGNENHVRGLEEWCKLKLPILEIRRMKRKQQRKMTLKNLKKVFYPS